MADRRLLTLYATTALICMVYGLMTPFLPLLGKDKHLSEEEVGVIFAAYPFAGLMFAPCIGSCLFRVGRRNTLVLSFVCMCVGFLASAGSVWLQHEEFFALNVAARALAGLSCSLMFTTVVSVIASDYPANVFEYVGVNESMVGLGFLIGPLVGAGAFTLLGFMGTFLFSAGFYAASGATVYILLGPDREYRITHNDENILRLIVRPKILVSSFPVFFGMISMGAQNMFISTHLEDNGLSRPWIAASFIITGICYVVFTYGFAKTIERYNKKAFNALGCGLCVVSMVLVGMEGLAPILAGFALEPIGVGLVFLEAMPSLIEVATGDLGLENDDKLLDKLSGTLHSAIITLGSTGGELFGPLIQGSLIPLLGVRDSCGVLAGAGVLFAVSYLGTFLLSPARSTSAPEAIAPLAVDSTNA